MPCGGLRVKGTAVGLPAMYSLSGLADESEDMQEVREHLRAKRYLFSPALQDEEVRATMACADRNHAVLKPLAKRLLTPEGTVGQLLVPELTRENFAWCFAHCLLRPAEGLSVASLNCVKQNWACLSSAGPVPRIGLLYGKMEIERPKQRELKRQAKQAKAFMVLVKKKLTREQVSRSKLFQKLLSLVFKPHEEADKC